MLDSTSSQPGLFKEPSSIRRYISPYNGSFLYKPSGSTYDYISADGLTRTLILPENTWFRTWLKSDQDIVVLGDAEYLDVNADNPAEETITILNLTTGKYDRVKVRFENLFARSMISPDFSMLPIYDPTLTRALYAWWDPITMEQGISLWDLQSGKEVWKKGREFFLGFPEQMHPAWQIDGSAIYISGGEKKELFQLSKAGVLTQLTQFSRFNKEIYEIWEPRVSPDGSYLAFVLNADIIEPRESRILYVLDLRTGLATNYCLTPVTNITWSPDSRQLAFSWQYRNTVVLDLDTNEAVEFDNMTHNPGWRK